MALCLPRRRRATSLATRPSTLSVASITNHSCTTSAGFALKVVMSFSFEEGLTVLFHGRCSSGESLLGGLHASPRDQKSLQSQPLYKNAPCRQSLLRIELALQFLRLLPAAVFHADGVARHAGLLAFQVDAHGQIG